jgi:superfamily I DNA/RNA helicase
MEMKMTKAFVPSPQQADFLNWVATGSGSCVLEAVAGAGKTTTLIEAVKLTSGNVAILAFNKKIADEISNKLKTRGIDWKQAQAGTVHSFGFSAYRKSFPKVKVEGRKVDNILERVCVQENAWAARWSQGIAKLVSLAKQRALGVIGKIENTAAWLDIIEHFDLFSDDEDAGAPIERIVAFAQSVLRASNDQTDVIDFDDMVYLPVLLKVRFWKFSWIFVDEAQDTNPARRALVRALLAPGGRVVAVGDRAQAIYGFTGADSDSLDLIASDFNATRLPLTTTYRCPKAVVAFAQQWVNHIHAHESAPEGNVSAIEYDDLFSRNDLNANSAILCRLNKPLVSLAFNFIRRGIPCKVEGRDIGNGLIKLATKWKGAVTLHGLESRLQKWGDAQVTRALAQKKESLAQSISDQVDTLQVIIDDCRERRQDSVAAVVERIKGLFEDNIVGLLTLSSIHKSKGREWPTVYWLDRAGTCPSKYARQEWQQEQERNLCYVAATRAMTSLVEVYGPVVDTE